MPVRLLVGLALMKSLQPGRVPLAMQALAQPASWFHEMLGSGASRCVIFGVALLRLRKGGWKAPSTSGPTSGCCHLLLLRGPWLLPPLPGLQTRPRPWRRSWGWQCWVPPPSRLCGGVHAGVPCRGVNCSGDGYSAQSARLPPCCWPAFACWACCWLSGCAMPAQGRRSWIRPWPRDRTWP